jgi:hypothetical protein
MVVTTRAASTPRTAVDEAGSVRLDRLPCRRGGSCRAMRAAAPTPEPSGRGRRMRKGNGATIESAEQSTSTRRRGGTRSALRQAIEMITPTRSAGADATSDRIGSEIAEAAARAMPSTIRRTRRARIRRLGPQPLPSTPLGRAQSRARAPTTSRRGGSDGQARLARLRRTTWVLGDRGGLDLVRSRQPS